MKWLDRMERKFGRFAVRNLMTYIITMNAVVFLLVYLGRAYSILNILQLNTSLVMKGEIWRLITFIFIPPSFSPIWVIFALYFYYMVGNSLENAWGSFKFNAYYFIGILGTIAAAFIAGGTTAIYLNLSLFLAFAYLFPNFEILIFFILPVKVKYLAWLELAFIGYTVLTQPMYLKLAALASIVNYVIFFGKDFINYLKSRRQVYNNRKRFFKEINGGRRRW